MTDQVPSTAGLAAALYAADCNVGVERFATTSVGAQHRYEKMARRLVAAGALTLLEVPPGHDSEPADLTDTAVGDPVARLASAVNVLSISVGFLRGPGGDLVLAGHFVGNPRDDPDREVATAWTMSKPAAIGFLRQSIAAAAAVSTALALEFATVAIQAGQSVMAAAPPTIVVAPANVLGTNGEGRHP